MSALADSRRDFFVSFNAADRAWAEWIAAELEAAGYTTFFQHWDFRPGSNFALEMHKAAALADRTIAVLSDDYLNALFTKPEWAASLVQDPTGVQRKLIPIRVKPCTPDGLLKAIVYADLVGLEETDARARLLEAVSDDRPKPRSVPFPDSVAKPFPGSVMGDRAAAAPAARAAPRVRLGVPVDHIGFYAALCIACFLLGAGLLSLMLWKVGALAAFGLTGKLFYLVLIPMGLAAAGFLFGVLRSVAIYRGHSFGGTVEMSGPILAAALVVWGGFALPPPEDGVFSMTVFVHGPGGPQDIVLRGHAKVVMDLNGNRRLEPIDEKGAAHFEGIPAEFRGKPVPIALDVEGFEPAEKGPRKLIGETLYFAVRKSAGLLYGTITDERGEPVRGAALNAGKFAATSDAAGRFEITIPGESVRQEMTLDVRAVGFKAQTLGVTPGANEIRVALKRAP
jgi:hypothetical protein